MTSVVSVSTVVPSVMSSVMAGVVLCAYQVIRIDRHGNGPAIVMVVVAAVVSPVVSPVMTSVMAAIMTAVVPTVVSTVPILSSGQVF